MSVLTAVVLGLVQGIAEFLPISSSGHLAIAEHLLSIQGASNVPDFFDVLLHLGTLVAVFAAYWDDIRDMIVEFFAGIGDLAAEGIALRRVVHDLLRGPPVVILAEQQGDVRLDRAAVRGSVRGVRGDAHGHQHRDGCDTCHGALEDRGLTHCLVHSFSFHCVLVDMEPILL